MALFKNLFGHKEGDTHKADPLPETQQTQVAESAMADELAQLHADYERLRGQLHQVNSENVTLRIETEEARSELQTIKQAKIKMEQELISLKHNQAAAQDASHTVEQMAQTAQNAGEGDMTAFLKEKLIDSAKMATLGQLVAGITHEINTPVGAINAASSNMQKIVPIVLHDLPITLSETDPVTRALFFKLVDRAMAFKEALSSRDERNYKKQVTETLEKMGIGGAAALAPGFVKMGVFEGFEEYRPILQHPKHEQLLELASNAGRLKINVDNIGIAINKAMRILVGLKNYSHKGNNDEPEMADVKELMETVLTVYHNALKYNIETTRNFQADIPRLLCYPDQLTQVWANLVNNAIQAMNATGMLQVDMLTDNNDLVVNITDSGPGVPPEIKDKIFEAFFTTKKKGVGTGLGLDICKQIIEKHQGTLSFESEPGKTTFTVRIPMVTNPPPTTHNTQTLVA